MTANLRRVLSSIRWKTSNLKRLSEQVEPPKLVETRNQLKVPPQADRSRDLEKLPKKFYKSADTR